MSIIRQLDTHPTIWENLGEFGIGCFDMTQGWEKGIDHLKHLKYPLKYGFKEKKSYSMSTWERIKAPLKFHQNWSTLKIWSSGVGARGWAFSHMDHGKVVEIR